MLTEPVIDELLEAIANIPDEAVNARARPTLERLKASTTLATDLQRGLKVPNSNKSSFVQIKTVMANSDGITNETIIGMIARNPNDWNIDAKHRVFAMVLSDVSAEKTEPAAEGSQISESKDAAQS